jgi:hypothetical protein
MSLKLQVASFELQATSFELQVTSYQIQDRKEVLKLLMLC